MTGRLTLRLGALVLALAACTTVGFVTGAQQTPAPGAETTLTVNQVMRVGETVITAEQLIARMWDYESSLEREHKIVENSLAYLRDAAVVEMESKRMGLSFTPEEIDAEVQRQIEFFKSTAKQQSQGMIPWQDWLQRAFRKTEEEFEEYLRERTPMVLKRRVLVNYFEESTESIESSHILHRTLSVAQETHKILKDTPKEKFREVFEDRAVTHSEDPGAGMGKGRLPRIFYKDGTLVDAAMDALWTLKDGEFSEPVKTEFGYHIFWRRRTLTPDAKPLAERRAELINAPETEQDRVRFNRWVRHAFNTQGYKLERRLPGFDCKPDEQ